MHEDRHPSTLRSFLHDEIQPRAANTGAISQSQGHFAEDKVGTWYTKEE
jgi:hypothetical protein